MPQLVESRDCGIDEFLDAVAGVPFPAAATGAYLSAVCGADEGAWQVLRGALVSDGKTLAIIRRPKYGVGDRGTVVLTFNVYVTESSAALQVFDPPKAAQIIAAYGVSDVADLEGKPCWVDFSSPGVIRWIGPWQR